MQPAHVIAQIRDGISPGAADLHAFTLGLADGSVSEAQAGAFAMAVYLRGLSPADRVTLTTAMRDSGKVMDWDLPGPILDKHSTGGIGDCASLVLAPALAALGAFVPMVSGRGLGHTGGTLDKLESIPGFSADQSEQDFRAIVAKTGLAIVAANATVAPADKQLYAVRDVTGTVDQIDLICASILSKKLAISPQALVLDIKQGSGAFMDTPERALELARVLVGTANGSGCKTVGLITDMNQPVASSIGNALEIKETIAVLGGKPGGRLGALCEALGGEVLALHGMVDTIEAGEKAIRKVLRDGAAAAKFNAMVMAQGGPANITKTWKKHLPTAPVQLDIRTETAGWLSSIDGVTLGQIVVELGGGRRVQSDGIDHAVGLADVTPLGTKLRAGQRLAVIHAATRAEAEAVCARVSTAFGFAQSPVEPSSLIYERVT